MEDLKDQSEEEEDAREARESKEGKIALSLGHAKNMRTHVVCSALFVPFSCIHMLYQSVSLALLMCMQGCVCRVSPCMLSCTERKEVERESRRKFRSC